MADVAGSRVITEDELDSTTLGLAICEILGILQLLLAFMISVMTGDWKSDNHLRSLMVNRITEWDERLLAEMSQRALNAAKPDASAEIAKHILSLVKENS
ncbi:hypothetical protein Gotri_020368 [Gossypium trilobum]|uniref:Uncharacterized protein n=1 Tax=Gossypium trilobum TaxID=34281 RepID=A0A7J9D955_9ROSI|nr:hypothetical protein [Gossypium trilobum]